MMEAGVAGESEAESDLFTELLGEEMISEMLIDLTNMKHPGYVEVEGGFGESVSTLKELQQSDSEQTDSEELSDDETEGEVVVPFWKEEEQVRPLPLRNRVQKKNEKHLNKMHTL